MPRCNKRLEAFQKVCCIRMKGHQGLHRACREGLNGRDVMEWATLTVGEATEFPAANLRRLVVAPSPLGNESLDQLILLLVPVSVPTISYVFTSPAGTAAFCASI